MSLILYESEEAKSLPTGTYLGLFHGRDTTEELPEDWGYYGPMIGPIIGYHTTYCDHIRIGFVTLEEAQKFFPAADYEWVDLEFDEGCLKYQDKFYGDWTVHQHTQVVK